MKLKKLIANLVAYDSKRDSIYIVEDIIKEIKKIEPKDELYINNILETIEKREISIFCLNMLTCSLRSISLSSTQIERVWKMLNCSHYQESTKEYLLKILSSISLDKYSHITYKIYEMFKNEISINKKIEIANVLINVNNFSDEIALWLYNFATNDSFSSDIENINTLAIKSDCCEILARNKSYLKSAKNALFHLIKECKFLNYYDEHQWSIIESTFYTIPLEDDDINYIIKLAKDKSLISYHRIYILSLLTKLRLSNDIIDNLIDMLFMKDETFEDFNIELMNIILQLEITPKHIEKIEKFKGTSNNR